MGGGGRVSARELGTVCVCWGRAGVLGGRRPVGWVEKELGGGRWAVGPKSLLSWAVGSAEAGLSGFPAEGIRDRPVLLPPRLGWCERGLVWENGHAVGAGRVRGPGLGRPQEQTVTQRTPDVR